MLEHEIEIFETLAGQIDALIEAENHYLEQHQFQQAVRLLPEKTRLGREYTKICDGLSKNPHFPMLMKERRDDIRKMAKNLQEKMHKNHSILEMALAYTDTVMQVFIKSHKECNRRNVYDRNGKTNGSQYMGIGQQA